MHGTLRNDGRPGAVLGIETSGEYLDLNPHIHMIVTDGLFDAHGNFRHMPPYDVRAIECLKSIWEHAVSKYVISMKYVNRETVEKTLSFRHTGFSTYTNRRIVLDRSKESSVKEFEQIARYIVKPSFSLNSIHYVPKSATVLYKGTMHAGNKSNFKIFSANDFLAAVTAHIPKYRQKYVNYYGEYSNVARGKPHINEGAKIPASQAQREYRKRWAMR